MNYFELINKVLIELDFREVSTFAGLTRKEHTSIKSILNNVNRQIVLSSDYYFRELAATLSVAASLTSVSNTISGRIISVILDSTEYLYDYDYQKFYKGVQAGTTYSLFGSNLLLSYSDSARDFDVLYLHNYPALSGGTLTSAMSTQADTSIIPAGFEDVLIYKTCIDYSKDSSNPQMQEWINRYNNAMRTLNSQCKRSVEESSEFIMGSPRQRLYKSEYTFGDYRQ